MFDVSLLCLCRKLLREHQLEVVTKAAQQEELERRRRLEQQRKQDFPVPLLPEYTAGERRHKAPAGASYPVTCIYEFLTTNPPTVLYLTLTCHASTSQAL